jgi:hypothetical protein
MIGRLLVFFGDSHVNGTRDRRCWDGAGVLPDARQKQDNW